jgi:hypothetical protein
MGVTSRRFNSRRLAGFLRLLLATPLIAGGLVVIGSGLPASAAPTIWSVGASPNPGTTNVLSGVSCVSASSCVAVGSDAGSFAQTLVETWDGVGWSVVASPNVGTIDMLNGISCVSAASCVAVGNFDAGSGIQTLVETWNGLSWSVTPSPNVGSIVDDLDGVSCASATSCVAVGTTNSGSGHVQTLVETWDGASWSVTSSPKPSTTNSQLLEVSCTSATTCVADGYYVAGSEYRTLVETLNSGSWLVTPSPSPGAVENGLSGLSCQSASSCFAVGYYYVGSFAKTLVETWDGTSWSVTPSPDSGSYDNALYGVSCVSASDCVAVGYVNDGSADQTLVETWNGTSWSMTSSPSPGTATNLLEGGVSCASTASCVAVGHFTNVGHGTAYQTLVLSGSAATVPDPPTNVSAAARNGAASVSWTTPADNGSPISSYTVTASPGGASVGVPGSQSSGTVLGLTNGTSYTFTVVATNGVGPSAPSTPSNAVTPTAPAIEVPSSSFPRPATVGTATVPVLESWPADSDLNGICNYDLQERAAGGAYTDVTLPTPTSTSVMVSLNPSTSYSFQLNVTDCGGIASGWGVQPTFTPLAWQESSTRLAYTGTWKSQSVAGAYGGALKYSTAKNASVSGSFFADSIAWVSETGPTLGKATVYLDGVAVKTVNLYSPTLREAQIVWKQGWSTQVKHAIKIVVAGTAGRARVDLDALLTLNIQ